MDDLSLGLEALEAAERIASLALQQARKNFEDQYSAVGNLYQDLMATIPTLSDVQQSVFDEKFDKQLEALELQFERQKIELEQEVERLEAARYSIRAMEEEEFARIEAEREVQIKRYRRLGFNKKSAAKLVDNGVLLLNGEGDGQRRRMALSSPGEVMWYIRKIPLQYINGISFEEDFFYVYIDRT